MSTTFEIQADDYSNIALAVVTPEGPESTTLTNYQANLASIRFNEEARIKFQYAQYQHREGGEVRDAAYPLVPVSFTGRVVGLGATPALRLADLAQKSADLMRIITNSNGYLKYKPDGLAAGVLDTYYRYIQSNPPRPLSGATEYWGRARASFEPTTYTEGIPTRQFEITLMTHPFALSDPTSPVEVLSATTLNNIGDGSNDHVTITNATVKGSVPAVTRIIAHPLTANAEVASLWIAKRTSGLANFAATYLGPTPQAPAGAWTTDIVDASRCDGEYDRLTPDGDDIVYSTRYTIANWASHKGRAAVLIVARNNSNSAENFDIYFRWAIANYPLTGDKKQFSSTDAWEPFLLGELDLPETEMSSQEALDLYIDICVVRTGGSGTFDLDCMKLLFTDEAAIQVDVPVGSGATTSQSFLLENLDEEVPHVIVHATNKLAYICNAYGDFITLEPDSDNRLDIAWKSYIYAAVTDDFSGYDANWEVVHACDTLWDDTTLITDRIEGGFAIHLVQGGSADVSLGAGRDYSGWANHDYFCVVHKHGPTGGGLTFRLGDGDDSFYKYKAETTYWEQAHCRKDGFSVSGSPDWGSIDNLWVVLTHPSATPQIDNWRWSKRDPASAQPNDFGSSWDYYLAGYPWFVYTDAATRCAGNSVPVGATYSEAGAAEQLLLRNTSNIENTKFSAKVYAFTSSLVANCKLGIVARCTDGTSGSEDCYALIMDTNADTLTLYEYIAGVPTSLGSVAFSAAVDTWYYFGIKAYGTSIKAYADVSLVTLWDSAKIEVTDSTHTEGKCGLIVTDGMGRFDDVDIRAAENLHVPTDQLQLSAYALFRTIYPFYES